MTVIIACRPYSNFCSHSRRRRRCYSNKLLPFANKAVYDNTHTYTHIFIHYISTTFHHLHYTQHSIISPWIGIMCFSSIDLDRHALHIWEKLKIDGFQSLCLCAAFMCFCGRTSIAWLIHLSIYLNKSLRRKHGSTFSATIDARKINHSRSASADEYTNPMG